MNEKYIREIENIIRKNLEQRGMDEVVLEGELEKAAKDFLTSSTVLIVTGFVIKDSLTGETDGPIGAVSLANALEKLGKKVVFVTDRYTEDILYSCCLSIGVKASIEIIPYEKAKEFCCSLIENYRPSHLVAIERPGRSQDGNCYSMRGENLSDLVPNTDFLFKKAKELGIITLAVGDGGNEVGMGKVRSFVIKSVDNGSQICAEISTDYLIIAGVSNWGGHALSAALSLFTDTMLMYDKKTEILLLKNMLESGAVDGCTKKSTLTVDGLSLDDNINILERLRSIVEIGINRQSQKVIV